jgi:CheY-like chemotaxis protein
MDTTKTVLCIDDEQSGLTVRKMLLESSGFHALTAASGLEGLDIFHSRPVDAVIVDYLMPEMDGAIVSSRIKQLKPRLPVIMLSAFATAREGVMGVVDAFIEKGGSPATLLSRLKSLIHLRSHIHHELCREYVVFADESRRYLDCSDGVCRLLGYSRSEMLEKTIDSLSYSPERAAGLFEQYRRDGKLSGEYVLVHKNGRPVSIRYESHVFPDGCMAAVWEPIAGWRELYYAALVELHPAKLKQRVELAQAAIEQRLQEKTSPPDAIERQALSDAISALRSLARE